MSLYNKDNEEKDLHAEYIHERRAGDDDVSFDSSNDEAIICRMELAVEDAANTDADVNLNNVFCSCCC